MRLLARTIAVALATNVLPGCTLPIDRPDVAIATGSPSGLYYPLGDSMCRLFNLQAAEAGRRCVAAPSASPIANIESLRSRHADIGIVPSDVLADAATGEGPFAARGPNTGLRVLFTGHAEAFTLVARRELGVRNVTELRGKRINMGSPGSGEQLAMTRIMAALGVSRADFADVRELSFAEQHHALATASSMPSFTRWATPAD